MVDLGAGEIAFTAMPEIDPGGLFGDSAIDTVISFGAALGILNLDRFIEHQIDFGIFEAGAVAA